MNPYRGETESHSMAAASACGTEPGGDWVEPWLRRLPLMLPGARMLGGVLIGAALGIDLWAQCGHCTEAHTTIMPNRGSTHLVTHGPSATAAIRSTSPTCC